MKEHTSIDAALERTRPTMSEADSARVWSQVARSLPTARPISSPYQFSWFSTVHLAPVALLLVVVLGVGSAGTYAAAQSAKPGDFLFPIERALEDLRLTIASDADGEVLRAEFARERLLEIQALIDAELLRLESTRATSASTTASTTLPGVVVSGVTRTHIDTGIDELLLLVGGLRETGSRDSIFAELKKTVDDITIRNHDDEDEYRLRLLDDGTRVEIRDEDDDRRIEMRDDDSRVRIREKDGEIRIDVKDEDDDDNDGEGNDDSRSPTAASIEEAEADVFTDITVVNVELSRGDDIRFTTTATTRSAVVAEIARRTGIAEAEVNGVLDFEIEDRSSRNDEDDDERDNDTSSDDSDRNDDDSDSSNSESSENQSSNDDAPIKKIDVEVERTVAQVEVENGDGTKSRFNLTYTTRPVLVTDLALRLNLTGEEVESLLKLEIDND